MIERVQTRARLALPLVIPCLAGLAYLTLFGAPSLLIGVNAGALVLALAWTVFGKAPADRRHCIFFSLALAGALFLPLATGPEMGGVARWFPAGPIALHSGPLLVPLIAVLAAREERIGVLPLALATLALSFQSDAAGLLAIGLASASLAWFHRSLPLALLAFASLGLSAMTFGDGTLEPQLYTEGVIAQAASRSVVHGAAMAVGLILPLLWYLAIRPAARRDEAYPLAAVMIGLSLAAALAPFPYPLIGYGASPILGFGLALGAARQPPS